MIPPITILRVMAEKMAHVELDSPQEVEMRQSMIALLMCFRGQTEPLERLVEATRRILSAKACVLLRAVPDADLEPQSCGDEDPSATIFVSATDWLAHYFLFYEIEALRVYITKLFDELLKADREREILQGETVRPIVDFDGLRESIPPQMKVRMRSEVCEHFEAFAAETLISRDKLMAVISLNLCEIQSLVAEEGRTVEIFDANASLRLQPASFKHWLTYYLQAYSVTAITELLLDLQKTHLGSNVKRYVKENVELKSGDWERIVGRYPHLNGKRAEFQEALCEVVMTDMNNTCNQYVYSVLSPIKIRPEHMASIKLECRFDNDPRIAYTIHFEHCEQGRSMDVDIKEAVFIRRIIAKMNMAPSLAGAEGLTVWGAVGEA